jgi:hypothetical protein
MSDIPKTNPPPAEPSVDEFAGIRARPGRHPALALAAAALALFIIFHVRGDITYSLSPREPVDLGDARALFARPGAEAVAGAANRYVQIRGTPDRESALELDTKGSWVFTQFFRILGTGSRLFVHRRENPLPAFRAEEDVFEGRLIRFGDLSFESSIRSYAASHVSATHFFRADDLRRAVAASAAAGSGAGAGAVITIRDLTGDPVTLGPNDLVAIDLIHPEEIRLHFPPDKLGSEALARVEVEKRGGVVISAAVPANPPGAGGVDLVVRFPPERRQAALDEIGDLDPRVEIREARQTFTVRLADVGDGGDALILKTPQGGGPPQRLPLAQVPAIRTLAAVQIPADAWLLIENDHPRDHLHNVIFGAVLLLFAAVNLIGLIGGLRRS